MNFTKEPPTDDRERFEAAMATQLYGNRDHPFYLRKSDGTYTYEWMQARWEVWQAKGADGVETVDGWDFVVAWSEQRKAAAGVKVPFTDFLVWALREGYDTAHTYDTERSRWVALNPMTADLWKCWQAASGVDLPDGGKR